MLKVAVCDDEKIFSDLISGCLTDIFKERSVKAELYNYVSSQLLLRDFQAENFDILFLDIDMPQSSGFDISKYVRSISLHTFIIFVSSKTELVYNSFEYTPFYFICKGDRKELYRELAHVVDKLLVFYQQEKKIAVTDIVCGKIMLATKDIVYIKSDKHYLYYSISDTAKQYTERAGLTAKEEEIGCNQIIRTHQRFLVNMRHIERFHVNAGTVLMDNGDEIPISRSMRDNVFQAYKKFKRG